MKEGFQSNCKLKKLFFTIFFFSRQHVKKGEQDERQLFGIILCRVSKKFVVIHHGYFAIKEETTTLGSNSLLL